MQQGDPAHGAQLYVEGAFKNITALEAAHGNPILAAQATGLSTQEIADVMAYLETLQ